MTKLTHGWLNPQTAAAFLLSAAACVGCYLAAGPSLGFYLGPVFVVALLAPPLVSSPPRLASALMAIAAVADAVGIAWLITVFSGAMSIGQWVACYVVLAAFAAGVSGITWAGRRWLGAAGGAAVATVLALAWLTWPVWLSPQLSGSAGASIAAWLSPAHPLLAINRIMIDSGIWTQQRLMYQHTALGQDVPFALPRTIWPCVGVHLFIGLSLLWAGSPSAPTQVRLPAGSDPAQKPLQD